MEPLLFIFSFVLSWGGTFFFRKIAHRFQIMDLPNLRSSHTQPTPRAGGVAIFISFFFVLFGLLTFFPNNSLSFKMVWGMSIGGLVVALVGFLDDIRGVSVFLRLITHILVGAILVSAGLSFKAIEIPFLGEVELNYFEIPLTLFWVVWIINIYNFMDGIDGLAAGVALILTVFLSIISTRVGNVSIFLLTLIFSGSVSGFLIHNFPPAKIFMGDIGSSFIGFMFAGFALIASQGQVGNLPIWVFILLLGAFIFDTGVTLIRRMLKGEKLFLAHRSHFYQRLIALHLTHRQVSLIEYSLAILLGLSSIFYLEVDHNKRGFILLGWMLLFTIGAIMIKIFEKTYLKKN